MTRCTSHNTPYKASETKARTIDGVKLVEYVAEMRELWWQIGLQDIKGTTRYKQGGRFSSTAYEYELNTTGRLEASA